MERSNNLVGCLTELFVWDILFRNRFHQMLLLTLVDSKSLGSKPAAI
jgi:hypothetical protein